jgi:hypothetical protein
MVIDTCTGSLPATRSFLLLLLPAQRRGLYPHTIRDYAAKRRFESLPGGDGAR